jgi:fructose-specific component phosphotransferase system IIB-like protein
MGRAAEMKRAYLHIKAGDVIHKARVNGKRVYLLYY